MSPPSVSVIIVNFNGRHLIEPCLHAAMEQTKPRNAELILVDNASTDGSVEYVRTIFPEVTLVVNARNEGFAGGANDGVRAARGDVIVLLNNDAVPNSGWLHGLLRALEPADVAVAASVIHEERYPPTYALGTGSISVIGHPIPHVGTDPAHPFYASGCSLAFKRSIFAEPFDAIYFAYYEDTLLSWRAHLLGYRVARALDSSVQHVGSATALQLPSLTTFLWERNKLLTLLLCYETATIWKLAPLYLFDGVARAAEDLWLLAKRPRSLLSTARSTLRRYGLVLRAVAWLAAHRSEVAVRRRAVQSLRRTGDAAITPMLSGKIFDDHVPTRGHAAANRIAMSYCRMVGIPTAEHAPAP